MGAKQTINQSINYYNIPSAAAAKFKNMKVGLVRRTLTEDQTFNNLLLLSSFVSLVGAFLLLYTSFSFSAWYLAEPERILERLQILKYRVVIFILR